MNKLINEEYEILFLEPTVLSMIRYDYKNLIKDEVLYSRIINKCYDVFEYLEILLNSGIIEFESIKNLLKQIDDKIFFHNHCQLKSLTRESAVINFFNKLGLKIKMSVQECCGMAGSFGYKNKYYKISKSLGLELINNIKSNYDELSNLVVLANGISCREQLHSFTNNEFKIYHPVEYLNKIFFVR